MALRLEHLVTSTISPHVGKGAPDCSKTKLAVQPHPREYFPAFFTYLAAHAWLALGKEWIPEGVVRQWVLSLGNRGLPSLHGDLLYSSPGAPSSAPFWTVQGMGRFPFDQIFRFEIPGIPCDKWNSMFWFVGLTNPRSSNGGLIYLCLLALGLLDDLK